MLNSIHKFIVDEHHATAIRGMCLLFSAQAFIAGTFESWWLVYLIGAGILDIIRGVAGAMVERLEKPAIDTTHSKSVG